MRIQASAGSGRNGGLGVYCYKLTLTVDHPSEGCAEMEGEFLSRLLRELKAGNTGFLLGQLRKWQDEPKPKRKPRIGGMVAAPANKRSKPR